MQNKLDNGTRTPKYFSEATPRKVLFVYLAAVLPHSLIVMNHANLVMEFFIPLLNRLGSTAPPDVVIGILTAFFVCLMAHFSLSTVHAVQSIKKYVCLTSACTFIYELEILHLFNHVNTNHYLLLANSQARPPLRIDCLASMGNEL